jgi:rhodanese-related sulfurtransferase
MNGRGRVTNPEEMPGGPKPEPPSGPPTSPPGMRSGPQPVAITHDETTAEEIGESELGKLLAARPRPTLLDIRERADFKRGHREGAVNIPRDELAVRGWIEIDRSRPVVIDCSQVETAQCQQAARMLIRGPKPVRVLIFLP